MSERDSEYRIAGAYGQWSIQFHRDGESGTRYYAGQAWRGTRADAQLFAAALNEAYANGRHDACDDDLPSAVNRFGEYTGWQRHAALVAAGVRVQLDHPCHMCGAEPRTFHTHTRHHHH